VTTTIPNVALDLESDPIAMGFVKTLARPGGNVTGVFMDLPDVSAKQLQLLREILPALSRVALLGDSSINAAQIRATERAAQALGVQAQFFETRTTQRARCRDRRRPAQRGRGCDRLLLASRLRPQRSTRRYRARKTSAHRFAVRGCCRRGWP